MVTKHIAEMTVDEFVTYQVGSEPDIGKKDGSPCLDSWIETCKSNWSQGAGLTLNKDALSALLHTLVAGRVRVARLIAERDAARRGQ